MYHLEYKNSRFFGNIPDADYAAFGDKQAADWYFSTDTKTLNFWDGTKVLRNTAPDKKVIIKAVADFPVPLLSNTEYFIDGIIDMGSTSLEIPTGGVYISGYNFDISQLISSADNYTMFTSPVGGSGNILFLNLGLEASGLNSQIYDIASATGFEAVEVDKINYNNCTSLGTISNYRQGLEQGTGRFGGSPQLTLSGVWAGGFVIDRSITRGLAAGFDGFLFKAGAGFTMSSRFYNNMNVDFPPLAGLLDFSPANLLVKNTLQLQDMIITRAGAIEGDQSTLLPNILESEPESDFKNNVGLRNTYRGALATISTEAATVINTVDVYEDLAGVFTVSNLQHFDNPVNNQFRYIGNTSKAFSISGEFVLSSNSNDLVDLRIAVQRSGGALEEQIHIRRVINNLAGGRDVGFFTLAGFRVILNENDYIIIQVENKTAVQNITAEIDSYLVISQL